MEAGGGTSGLPNWKAQWAQGTLLLIVSGNDNVLPLILLSSLLQIAKSQSHCVLHRNVDATPACLKDEKTGASCIAMIIVSIYAITERAISQAC
eukprot:scaffold109141_cov50-Prasinocladus_malaysianus.AAC.1